MWVVCYDEGVNSVSSDAAHSTGGMMPLASLN